MELIQKQISILTLLTILISKPLYATDPEYICENGVLVERSDLISDLTKERIVNVGDDEIPISKYLDEKAQSFVRDKLKKTIEEVEDQKFGGSACDFIRGNKLGKGNFGFTYKGTLSVSKENVVEKTVCGYEETIFPELDCLERVGLLRGIKRSSKVCEKKKGQGNPTNCYHFYMAALPGRVIEDAELKTMDVDEVRKIMDGLFAALDELHEKKGLTHGDVRAANFLVEEQGDDRIVHLIDYGGCQKAWESDDAASRRPSVMFTPAYCPTRKSLTSASKMECSQYRDYVAAIKTAINALVPEEVLPHQSVAAFLKALDEPLNREGNKYTEVVEALKSRADGKERVQAIEDLKSKLDRLTKDFIEHTYEQGQGRRSSVTSLSTRSSSNLSTKSLESRRTSDASSSSRRESTEEDPTQVLTDAKLAIAKRVFEEKSGEPAVPLTSPTLLFEKHESYCPEDSDKKKCMISALEKLKREGVSLTPAEKERMIRSLNDFKENPRILNTRMKKQVLEVFVNSYCSGRSIVSSDISNPEELKTILQKLCFPE